MDSARNIPTFIDASRAAPPETVIKQEADRCVACGLCLPVCPTYRKLRTENESPRGRIALMRALAQGDLQLSPRLESHLALCLACRACERACPSGVRFGQLIDTARALIENQRRRPGWPRVLRAFALDYLIARPRNLRLAGRVLRLYQISGLQSLLRKSGFLGLKSLKYPDSILPVIPSQEAWRKIYPAEGSARGNVMLFTGCVAGITDKKTLRSSIYVLNRLGYHVNVPADQACCGALHLHEGDPAKAEKLMRRNITAFDINGTVPVISCASGCGAMLKEYDRYLLDEPAAKAFSSRNMDINQFLAESPWLDGMTLRPLHKRIAVHEPCTLTHVLRQGGKPRLLLEKIPGAEILPLPDNHICCGGAGAYLLTQPEMADSLRRDKLEHLKRLRPHILATANVGCAMHLAAGIREVGLGIEVVHPVVLIERQVRGASG